MPNTGKHYAESEIAELIHDYENRRPDVTKRSLAAKWGMEHGFSPDGVRAQIDRQILLGKIDMGRIPESPYPSYNEPLEMTSEAVLVLPDIEAPLHHSEFLNRVLNLAEAWNVKDCILAGDALHLDTFSSFHKPWVKEKTGGLDASAEKELMDFAQTLGSRQQGRMMEKITEMGKREETDGASTELKEAGRILARLADQFDNIDWVLGNHCGRALRVFETALTPDTLLNLVHIPDGQRARWRTAPYYYSVLFSGGLKYLIEHPRNAAKFSASKLASKYLANIIMGHSHHLNFTFDPSGEYYAIECGTCSDEQKMAYVSQRHNVSPQHALGAVIVKSGFPWLLHARSPFDRLRML